MKTETKTETTTKGAQHTPGPWRVQADPLLSGRHPLHDNRYITTDHDMETWRSPDAEGHGDDCAGFVGDGKIIATMTDGEHQAADAALLAAAPELLAALRAWETFWNDMPKGQLGKLVFDVGLLNDAFIKQRAAIAKATGQE